MLIRDRIFGKVGSKAREAEVIFLSIAISCAYCSLKLWIALWFKVRVVRPCFGYRLLLYCFLFWYVFSIFQVLSRLREKEQGLSRHVSKGLDCLIGIFCS